MESLHAFAAQKQAELIMLQESFKVLEASVARVDVQQARTDRLVQGSIADLKSLTESLKQNHTGSATVEAQVQQLQATLQKQINVQYGFNNRLIETATGHSKSFESTLQSALLQIPKFCHEGQCLMCSSASYQPYSLPSHCMILQAWPELSVVALSIAGLRLWHQQHLHCPQSHAFICFYATDHA